MGSYKLLSKFKYGENGNTRLTDEQIDEEYIKRLTGYSTVVTNMHPTLVDKQKLEVGIQASKSLSQTNYPIFWVTTPKMMNLIDTIHQLSHAIDSMINTNQLPPVAISSYLRAMLTNEIFFSNEIEGVHTNPNEIETIVWDAQNNDKEKNRRLESTIRKYTTSLKGEQHQINKLSDIRDVYDQLLDEEISEDDKPDGNIFRKSFVYIGNAGKAVHLPPDNEQDIETALNELIIFMNSDSITPLIKSIVTHFMFENTHPFKDGNGRTGRYLLSSYLSKKIDNYTGLTISTAIHTHVQEYYKLFRTAGDVENRADLTEFIIGMLKIIADGQREVLKQLQIRLDSMNDNFKNLKHLFPKLSEEKLSIIFILLQSKLFAQGSSMGENNGIQDRELRELVKSDGISRRRFSELMDSLENDDRLIKTVSKRPLQHILLDEYLI